VDEIEMGPTMSSKAIDNDNENDNYNDNKVLPGLS
jgi:hypothetical protein